MKCPNCGNDIVLSMSSQDAMRLECVTCEICKVVSVKSHVIFLMGCYKLLYKRGLIKSNPTELTGRGKREFNRLWHSNFMPDMVASMVLMEGDTEDTLLAWNIIKNVLLKERSICN